MICQADGILIYDGTMSCTYDAWNRLTAVAYAFQDPDANNSVLAGRTVDSFAYDAAGRRISKTVNGTGSMDGVFHYYYNNQQQIEVRNASNIPIKQQVWGLEYVDELVQIAINNTPSSGNNCTNLLYAVQDANYNVTALYNNVNNAPHLVERYEYNPYGQRTVYQYFNSSLNYTTNIGWGCDNPTFVSRRFVDAANITQSYGLCEFGHQGLYHDEEIGLIYNRARTLHPGLGRFMQEELYGAIYYDGPNLYLGYHNDPINKNDVYGTRTESSYTGKAKITETLSSYNPAFFIKINQVTIECSCEKINKVWDWKLACAYEYFPIPSIEWYRTPNKDYLTYDYQGEKPWPVSYHDYELQKQEEASKAIGALSRSISPPTLQNENSAQIFGAAQIAIQMKKFEDDKTRWENQKKVEMDAYRKECQTKCANKR